MIEYLVGYYLYCLAISLNLSPLVPSNDDLWPLSSLGVNDVFQSS
jgi:hypothetical protein